jgi:hypothetical protein
MSDAKKARTEPEPEPELAAMLDAVVARTMVVPTVVSQTVHTCSSTIFLHMEEGVEPMVTTPLRVVPEISAKYRWMTVFVEQHDTSEPGIMRDLVDGFVRVVVGPICADKTGPGQGYIDVLVSLARTLATTSTTTGEDGDDDDTTTTGTLYVALSVEPPTTVVPSGTSSHLEFETETMLGTPEYTKLQTMFTAMGKAVLGAVRDTEQIKATVRALFMQPRVAKVTERKIGHETWYIGTGVEHLFRASMYPRIMAMSYGDAYKWLDTNPVHKIVVSPLTPK